MGLKMRHTPPRKNSARRFLLSAPRPARPGPAAPAVFPAFPREKLQPDFGRPRLGEVRSTRRRRDLRARRELRPLDRKSTRLNSSHLVISYAVFCLKKKKKKSVRAFDIA